ncbi:MAG: hypothetical protein C0473_01140 [Cyanobacteria bacterium DS3.002]|nr:hypothetical protein [Cyanobacteria bacterium DS3.002]
MGAPTYFKEGITLVVSLGFRWLFFSAILVGLTSAPFYAFAISFLIRVHGFTTTEAGAAFGLLQGLMGILRILLGGWGFDRCVRSGRGQLLFAPSIVFFIASFTTLVALLVQNNWLTVILFVPGMFSFAFLLPWAFGSAHLVAGPGKQALASSLVQIGSSFVGPTLGPLMVGMVSDAATAAHHTDGLRWGLLLVPVASFLTGLALLHANNST